MIKVIEIIDGQVDYIFVDNEKIILLQNFKDLKSVTNKLSNEFKFIGNKNLSYICFDRIKKSKIFEFKPSDITVNATWSFLSQRLNFLSGKKVSILGSGNIGSKLALKLVESNVNVSITRKNNYKGKIIAPMNIKSENTASCITLNQTF